MSKNTEEERAVELPFSSPQPGGLLCSHLDSWGSPHLSRAGEIALFLREEGRKEGKWFSYISGDKSGVAIKAKRAAKRIINFSSLDVAGVVRA